MERDWMRRMEEMQKNEEATSKNHRDRKGEGEAETEAGRMRAWEKMEQRKEEKARAISKSLGRK